MFFLDDVEVQKITRMCDKEIEMLFVGVFDLFFIDLLLETNAVYFA